MKHTLLLTALLVLFGIAGRMEYNDHNPTERRQAPVESCCGGDLPWPE